MNVHAAITATIHTDEHGTTADVVCGAVGSYYTTDPAKVTCRACRLAEYRARDRAARIGARLAGLEPPVWATA